MNGKFTRLKLLLVALCGTCLLLANLTAYADQIVTYVHTDRLGNPAMETDSTGAVIWRQSYTPYGETSEQADPDGPGFTGHRHDQATGLVYMQARYYDPKIGRFLSPDPVTFSPNQPQFFNRYWYANGNPYRYTDPDGRAGAAAIGGFFVCGPPCAAAAVVVKFAIVAGAAYWIAHHSNDQPPPPPQDKPQSGPTSDSEPGTSNSDEGCIYCVNGKNTQSGKDYVGSTDDLGKRAGDKSDGRNREGAKKIDSYKKGDRQGRRNKEQQAINDRGGKGKLDNKRNEVAEKHWPKRDIKPPQNQ